MALLTTPSTAAAVTNQTNTIVGIADNLNGTYTITFVGTPQMQYCVVASPDSHAPVTSWLPLAGSTNTVTDPNGLWTYTVTNATSQQFYRSAVVTPAP